MSKLHDPRLSKNARKLLRATLTKYADHQSEFDLKLRHYCRHLKCRSKLQTPVSNNHEAFCTRGCYQSFHLKRCGVCEGALEQRYRKLKRGDLTKFAKVQNPGPTCGSAECKRRWREGDGLGRFWPKPYQGSQSTDLRSEVPVNGPLFSAVQKPKNAKRWVRIAGPPLNPNQFHPATVSDGPNCQWKAGEYERVEAKNRAALKAADEAAIEANGYFTDPDWREVVSPDGVKGFVTSFVAPARRARALPHPLTADLSIPEFLSRT